MRGFLRGATAPFQVPKLSGPIKEVQEFTGETVNRIKEKLRGGRYKARRDGKLIRVDFQSVIDDFYSLPEAEFGGDNPLADLAAAARQRDSNAA